MALTEPSRFDGSRSSATGGELTRLDLRDKLWVSYSSRHPVSCALAPSPQPSTAIEARWIGLDRFSLRLARGREQREQSYLVPFGKHRAQSTGATSNSSVAPREIWYDESHDSYRAQGLACNVNG